MLASQPLDVIRVRLQTSVKTRRTGQLTAQACASRMWVNEGMFSFYKGTIPPMCGVGVLMSIAFSSQQWMRRLLTRGDRQKRLSASENMMCGFVGGCAQAPLANMIELLKVRLQCQRSSSTVSNVASPSGPLNLRQMMIELFKTRGMSWMTRGLSATVARDAIGYACYFGFCESAMAWLAPKGGSKRDVPLPVVTLIGMLGGVVYWLPIMPLDTIKSRLHADSLTSPSYKGAWDCATKSIRIGGVASLYRGIIVTVLYCLPKNAAKLPTFEFASSYLEAH